VHIFVHTIRVKVNENDGVRVTGSNEVHSDGEDDRAGSQGMCMYVCMCVDGWMCICISRYLYVCAWVCFGMCVCVCVCVCVLSV